MSNAPDFEDLTWEQLRKFHQGQVETALGGLLVHAGNPQMVRFQFGNYTVNITANPKQVTQ